MLVHVQCYIDSVVCAVFYGSWIFYIDQIRGGNRIYRLDCLLLVALSFSLGIKASSIDAKGFEFLLGFTTSWKYFSKILLIVSFFSSWFKLHKVNKVLMYIQKWCMIKNKCYFHVLMMMLLGESQFWLGGHLQGVLGPKRIRHLQPIQLWLHGPSDNDLPPRDSYTRPFQC